ncbi:MAG: penicillin acylase family protein [Vicinamibacterales bacterium]
MAASRLRRALLVIGVVLLLIVGGIGVYVHQRLAASLPATTGTRIVAGLAGPVTVARDGLGIPTITAGSRADAARALGFVHAQERFFQMDLQRRQPAGELSALVGARALPVDRRERIHRFRDVARRALALASPDYRAVLEAYAEGVNAGLEALEGPPFEYLLLEATPEPWRAEDSILTILAMFESLQGRQAMFEKTHGEIHDVLPAPLADYLTARGSTWDAPVVGQPFPRPALPGPDVIDLRTAAVPPAMANGAAAPAGGKRVSPLFHGIAWKKGSDPFSAVPGVHTLSAEQAAGIGSNNWVVSGALTSSGAALVANDMHLQIGVPNIWYRAVMRFPDPGAPDGTRQLAGVTLPGLPSLVVGSNGQIAWGFTNSSGDWSDLVIVDRDPRDPQRYLTPSGPRRFEVHEETIVVKDAAPETLPVPWTIWGPIVGTTLDGRPLAQRWVAHDADRLSSDVLAPERSATTRDAITRTFPGLGIPAQNVVVGDREGHIGWTIAGPIPRRVGHDGMRPVSWADGSNRWDGFLPPDEFPRIVDPPGGRIWTANAPVVTDERLAVIGEGGYADGIRARLIRDRLRTLDVAAPGDMLRIQLEDGALFLERWRQLAMAALDPSTVEGHAGRAEFKRLVRATWTGRASTGSVGYRLIREFRSTLVARVLDPITAPVRAADPDFDFDRALRTEGAVWPIVTGRPAHLLPAGYADWHALFVDAVDDTVTALTASGEALEDRTWGEYNRAAIVHPLASALGPLARLLDMPADALDGDTYTPRAVTPRTGPSERMAVSPGQEQAGILHMPTGQSGHPLSPHYRDQQDAWVRGLPLPFMPGPTVEELTLTPQ